MAENPENPENLYDKLPFDGLKTASVLKNDNADIRLITLQSGAVLPEHTSPVDASIVVLEGRMRFVLPDAEHQLQKGDFLSFGAKVPHRAEATEDCRFVLIR